jgi:GNAT superfamily N-acetyltransferase
MEARMNDQTFAETKVTFAVEPLVSDDQKVFAELQEAHYREVAAFRSVLDRLNPDWEKYQAMEKNGRLHLVKARAWNRALVGYSAHMVYTALHYKHVLVAEDDVQFLTPTMRGRGIGKAMRQFACDTLKARGVQLVLARFKVAHPHDKHITELGYEPMETVWAKVL